MHEKFREAWRGASYIASGLHSDFPDAMVDIELHHRNKITKRRCSTQSAGPILEEFCRSFPMATVYYHGRDGYGFVAQIRCHCGHEKSRGCCREGRHHRAKLLISLSPVEKRADIKVESG